MNTTFTIYTIQKHKKCSLTAKALKAIYKRKMWKLSHSYYNEYLFEVNYTSEEQFKPGLLFRHYFWNIVKDIWKDENTVWLGQNESVPLGFTGVMLVKFWDSSETLYVKSFKTVPDEKQ